MGHLSDHVLPPLPLRQWVLSVPKRLRYFLPDDAVLQGVVVRILLRAVERCLREHSPGSSAAGRLGAVVFIHRFGSALNAHLHFHCCILDGVFEPAHATDAAAGVVFHEARGPDATAVATVQAQVRQRVLRAFIRHGLLAQSDGDAMGGWDHGGGFSLDASVRIEGADLAGRERLLRYCARPPFALERLHQHDAEHLVYDIAKPRPDGPRTLVLTPIELIDQVAALVPPPARAPPSVLWGAGAQRTLARCRHRAGAGTGATTAPGRPGRDAAGIGAPCCCALPVGHAARAHL